MSQNRLPRTVIIGGANLDITANSFDRLIPGDSNPGSVTNSPGGVGRNIAENLARLGHQCQLVSLVGRDVGQSIITDSCRKAGIDCTYLFDHAQLSTGTYVAINNSLGTLLAAISDMAVIDALTPDLLERALPAISAAEQIVVEANLSEKSLLWACQHKGTAVLHADAVSAAKAPRLTDILSSIDILKVNRFEAAAILQTQADDYELAEQLYQRGAKQVLLSQGPQGALVHNQHGVFHRSAIKGETENDTGAGDALFSGFVTAQHLFTDTRDQLEFAIACATYTLSSTASVHPNLTISNIQREFRHQFRSNV